MASGKRSEQAEQRRNQLVDAALDLFSQQGIEGTRVSDIARAAGVAQGLLYHYFPGKDALLAAIIARHGPIPILQDLLATSGASPARETLLRLSLRLYTLAQERRAFVRLFIREIIWRPEALSIGMAVREQALAMLAGYLASRAAAGELRPHDSRVVGQTIASAVILPALAELPYDPYVTGAIDTILQGIMARPDNAVAPLEQPSRGE
ncbi:MAG TPA: TetR/AcrR family transcriptional regulator [Ktedonobacterales bacterium]|jgi:AcrR family transcriptional regulator